MFNRLKFFGLFLILCIIISVVLSVSVSAACVRLENGACYTVSPSADGTIDRVQHGPYRIYSVAQEITSEHPEYAAPFEIFLDNNEIRDVVYGKVCALSKSDAYYDYECVFPESVAADVCAFTWWGCASTAMSVTDFCGSWAVKPGKNDVFCRGFEEGYGDCDAGSLGRGHPGISVNGVCGRPDITCASTDTDGDGLGRDCPDSSRACVEGIDAAGTCYGVDLDDEGCELVPSAAGYYAYRRCMNFCIDEDGDSFCAKDSRRIDIRSISGEPPTPEVIPNWYSKQADDFYERAAGPLPVPVSAVLAADRECPILADDPSCCVDEQWCVDNDFAIETVLAGPREPPIGENKITRNLITGDQVWSFTGPCAFECSVNTEVVEQRILERRPYVGVHLDPDNPDVFIDPDDSGDLYDGDVAGWLSDGRLLSVFDCDDHNPSVTYPKLETCNLIDDDCDKEIDECSNATNEAGEITDISRSCVYKRGFLSCQVWDADGDNYLNADFGCPSCTDCDDTDESVNPGEPDCDADGTNCGGGDNNCNGLVDEMRDTDQDGVPDEFETDICVGQNKADNAIIDAYGCHYSITNGNIDAGWGTL